MQYCYSYTIVLRNMLYMYLIWQDGIWSGTVCTEKNIITDTEVNNGYASYVSHGPYGYAGIDYSIFPKYPGIILFVSI